MARKKNKSKTLAPHIQKLQAQIQLQNELLNAIPSWNKVFGPLEEAAVAFMHNYHDRYDDQTDTFLSRNEVQIAGKLKTYKHASQALLSSSLEPTLIREIDRDDTAGFLLSSSDLPDRESINSFWGAYGIKDWRLCFSHEVLTHMGFDKEERTAIRKDIFQIQNKLFETELQVPGLSQKHVLKSYWNRPELRDTNLAEMMDQSQHSAHKPFRMANPKVQIANKSDGEFRTPGFFQLTRCYRNAMLVYLFGELDWILCEGEITEKHDDSLYWSHDDNRYFHAWLKLKRKDGTEVIFEPTARNFQLSFPEINRNYAPHKDVVDGATDYDTWEVYSDFGPGVPCEVVYPTFSKDAYSPFVEFLPSLVTKAFLFGQNQSWTIFADHLQTYAYQSMVASCGYVVDPTKTRVHQDLNYIVKSYHVINKANGFACGSQRILENDSLSQQNILNMMNGIYFLPALLQNNQFWEFLELYDSETRELLIEHLQNLKSLQDNEIVTLIPSWVSSANANQNLSQAIESFQETEPEN
jgi:hypothetical protein